MSNTEKEKCDKWLTRFDMYREEDRHECNLITVRINALLYSQAFLAVAAGEMYEKMCEYPDYPGLNWAFLLIASVVFLVIVATSLAIVIGCRVLAEWHRHGTQLIDDAENDCLDRYFLFKRKPMPDSSHWWSINVLSWGLPLILGIRWLISIACVGVARIHWSPWIPIVCLVALFICWVRVMKWAWSLAKDVHKRGTKSSGDAAASPAGGGSGI